jgi:D-alanyl-D-alanine carboxypeptidase
VFGGRSTASRNARVAELLDLGFDRAKKRVALRKPKIPPYLGKGATSKGVVVARSADIKTETRGKTVRVAKAAVTKSLRPVARPVTKPSAPDVAPLVATVKDDIESVLREVPAVAAVAPKAPQGRAPEASVKPVIRPKDVAQAKPLIDVPTPARKAEVVTRLSTSGGRHWGINVGRYPNRFAAEKILIQTALFETTTLDGALRKVIKGKKGFDANFMGLTRDMAELACQRLQARQVTCFMIGPS